MLSLVNGYDLRFSIEAENTLLSSPQTHRAAISLIEQLADVAKNTQSRHSLYAGETHD